MVLRNADNTENVKQMQMVFFSEHSSKWQQSRCVESKSQFLKPASKELRWWNQTASKEPTRQEQETACGRLGEPSSTAVSAKLSGEDSKLNETPMSRKDIWREVSKSSNNVRLSDPEPRPPWTWFSPGSTAAKQSLATPTGDHLKRVAACESETRFQPMRRFPVLFCTVCTV